VLVQPEDINNGVDIFFNNGGLSVNIVGHQVLLWLYINFVVQ
jgi:hypothetical protein